MDKQVDVAVIGAGPSGTIIACLLLQAGFSVTIFEKEKFPRFVIGESLLPQCLTILESAKCLSDVEKVGFQKKIGAKFKLGNVYKDIIFANKFTEGPDYAYHVERPEFDSTLANCAVKQGAKILFEKTVISASTKVNDCSLTYLDNDTKKVEQVNCRFIVDASGYNRLLAKLLKIDKPSDLIPRSSLFTHIKDNIADSEHERNKTLITIHQKHNDIWFWLISFTSGYSSVGAVAKPEYISKYKELGIEGLQQLINEDEQLAHILRNAEYNRPLRFINSYSASIDKIYDDGFVILGNAGEFLDPVFSSGITAAIQSSDLAAKAIIKTLNNQYCDWEVEYRQELMLGINTFKEYVTSWYSSDLQKIIFADNKNIEITKMISSVLAGYAWDNTNPFVKSAKSKLEALVTLC